ncbi:hypothetical protein Nmel_009459 [Mimus melanotis]
MVHVKWLRRNYIVITSQNYSALVFSLQRNKKKLEHSHPVPINY